MDLDARKVDSKLLPQSFTDQSSSPCSKQQQNYVSSVNNMEIKHLGLSNMTAVNKCSRTDDETTCFGISRVTEIPVHVTDHSPSKEHPQSVDKSDFLDKHRIPQLQRNRESPTPTGHKYKPKHLTSRTTVLTSTLTNPKYRPRGLTSTPRGTTSPPTGHISPPTCLPSTPTCPLSTPTELTSQPTCLTYTPTGPIPSPTSAINIQLNSHTDHMFHSVPQDGTQNTCLCPDQHENNRHTTSEFPQVCPTTTTHDLTTHSNKYDPLPSIKPIVGLKLDEGNPKYTLMQPEDPICESNSQKSSHVYLPDRQTLELASDDKTCRLNAYVNQCQNNNHCVKETCFRGCSDSIDQRCNSYISEPSFNNPERLINEKVFTESNQDRQRLLQHQDSVSEPVNKDLNRKRVFFSHCPQDTDWVEHIVAQLEAPPFNYTCTYTSQQNQVDTGSEQQQRVLYDAMLCDRIILVLSKTYVDSTWNSFEKIFKKLTRMNLHNQRIMGVVLEDCQIPDSLEELYFLDASGQDFLQVLTKRLKASRLLSNSDSINSDLTLSTMLSAPLTNGAILTTCRLHVKVGWNSFLVPADERDVVVPSAMSDPGIGMEKPEFQEIVVKVSGIMNSSNKLPWLLSAQPLVTLLVAGGLWLPAFISILALHVDEDSGIALPVRLLVFLFPLALGAGGYFIKWRRCYWLTKIVRLLIQNCVDVNQAFYFQGRPLFVTAAHARANVFDIYFVYFDATECVSVDLLLFTCMQDDWQTMLKLITFYTRDENYLSRMSISERLTVMMSAPYLVKLVKQALPNPPHQRHVSRLLCLCQFTEECISRFTNGLEREDVPGLAELFTRHMPGKVSGSAVKRVQEELFHANHGLVP